MVHRFLIQLAVILTFAASLIAASITDVVPRAAPPGARVILAGTGLDAGGIVVTFAGSGGVRQTAAVVTRTATLMEVRVPVSAATGELRAASGSTSLVTIGFTVTSPPTLVKSTTLAVSSPNHGTIKQPHGPFVPLPDGSVYFADTEHHQIKTVTPAGVIAQFAGGGNPGLADGIAAAAQFKSPEAVVIDRLRSVLYVADTGNHVIRAVTLTGTVSTFAGSGRPEDRDGTGTQAGFQAPAGLAIDADGNLYVADTGNDKIRKVTPAGVVTTWAGAGRPGASDGLSLQALFKSPRGIAVTNEGIVYVADTGNHTIRKIENGIVATFAGTGHPGSVDGAAHNADFKEPAALVIDESGDLFVADSGNHQIRRIAGGAVSTIAGNGRPGLTDGPDLTNVQYKQPSGIASEGALFIADSGNDALRVLYRSVVATDLYPRSGDPNGGETVRLFGAGFVPGRTAVTFGGVPAQVVYESSTELLVTTPAGALGTSVIAITTPAGTATLPDAFRYIPPFVSIAITPATASLDPDQSLQLAAAGLLSGGGTADLTARVGWSSSDPNVATVDATGLVQALHIGSVTITATLESLSATATIVVRDPTPVPPDPSGVAPPLPSTGGTSLSDSTTFLYTGPNAIQTGVTPGTIAASRAGVIRGRVVNPANAPLAGATITIAGHPEYGSTLSRADGAFDLAVNGGQPLTVRCEKAGFFPADRLVNVPWQDFAPMDEDIRLVALDANVTTIASEAATVQVARGSVVTDASGTRRATMLFLPGTTATMELSDGTTQALPSLHVRATEYSVGNDGARSMPGPLPPQSAYTYCVELSVDEALAADATTVRFSTFVPFYVENFLGFAVGTPVPAATYDRTKHVWMPSFNGLVIRIVSIQSGVAHVDTTGRGTADDGIPLAEREQLALLYPAGTTLWRASLLHFSPYDLNFPALIVDPQARSLGGQPTYYAPTSCDWWPAEGGSIIDCPTQTLGEDVGITGTGFALHYRSDRTTGRVASRTIHVPLTGAAVPASLLRVEVEASIAGQLIRETFPAAPNQTFHFVWDGRDAYGRTVTGARPVTIRASYFYPAEYERPPTTGGPAFGRASGLRAGVPARLEVPIAQIWTGQLGTWTAAGEKLGDWTITPHHFYDVAGRTLYRGDGSHRTDAPQQFGDVNGVMVKIAGTTSTDTRPVWTGLGCPATSVTLDPTIRGIAAAPDGSVYLGFTVYIRRVTPDGRLVPFAGNGLSPLKSDPIPAPAPATESKIGLESLTVAPDGTVYFAEPFYGYIRHIEADGTIRVIAGRNNGSIGDGIGCRHR
jgi:hypothetical protein